MTNEEILKILLNKTNKTYSYGNYFTHKFFKKDDKVYARRSFDDLFIYFRKYGVTEKQLLEVLANMNCDCFLCPDIGKFVFYPCTMTQIEYKELNINNFYISTRFNVKETVNTKYTFDYLLNLLKEIKEKTINDKLK